MLKLLPSPRGEQLAWLCGLLGILAGIFWGDHEAQVGAAKRMAEHPDSFACGNAWLGVMAASMLLFRLGGALIGKLLDLLLPKEKRRK